MKLSLTPEADSVNVQALNMGRIVVDIDGVNLAELINMVCDNGYSLRVVDQSDRTATDSKVGAKQIPIIGVNMGRLGFLANISPSEI